MVILQHEMTMAKSASKIKLRGSGSIGSPAAETDHAYLKECFVNLPLIVSVVRFFRTCERVN